MTTIAAITARGLLGRRRFLLLVAPPLLVAGLVLLSSSFDVDPALWGEPVLAGLGLAVVLPVVALVVGTGVLASEIDEGTVVHILATPVPRWQIIAPKLAVATGVTTLTVAVPLAVAGVLADSARLGLGLAAASAVGALAYCALFLALSLLTRRPVLLGLVYVLVWEGLLGNFVAGARALSIQQYAVAIADAIAPTELLDGRVALPVVVVMAAVITTGATALAIDRLRSFSLAGETS